MRRILWMDNDRTFLLPHVSRLRLAGYDVVRAYTVSAAEDELQGSKKWDVVIIDPMMNISEQEEEAYPPSKTDGGLKAGVVFYSRNKEVIKRMGAHPVVFTMRDDSEIVDDFIELGIDEGAIKNKMDASDTEIFLNWINDMMKESEECVPA